MFIPFHAIVDKHETLGNYHIKLTKQFIFVLNWAVKLVASRHKTYDNNNYNIQAHSYGLILKDMSSLHFLRLYKKEIILYDY